ncbi:MAG: SpoIIE family protein phosphatase [Clostridia bacterium]|nr:SpoIIE family protein phosphatase [Clostridia bacterium]
MIGTRLKKIKERLSISPEIKMILFEVLLFALGFFLTGVKFLFSTYPFGIALVGSSKKYTPFVFAGAILSVVFFMDSSIVYLVALVGLLGLRTVSSFIKKRDESKKTYLGERQGEKIARALFCEDVELRIAVSALTALGIGIYSVIANGYVYYDTFVLIFNTVFVSILTYCISGIYEQRQRRSTLLGLCTVAFCLMYALHGREIQGIDITIILSYSLVLYVSKHQGGIKGGALGLVLGIAHGATYSAVLGIGGVVSGFLWGISPYLAVMCSFILSIGYGIAMIGYEAIVFLTPEMLAASLLMYPLIRFELLPTLEIMTGNEIKGMELYRLQKRVVSSKMRIDKLSATLIEVSKMLKTVSGRIKSPDKNGYSDMSLEVCEGYCYSCPKENICWQRDVDTTQSNIEKIGEALFARKEVTKGDVDEKFLHRCPNIEKIMEELNRRNKEILAQSVKNDKLDVSAQDYDAIGKMVATLLYEEEDVKDKQMTERAGRGCAKSGLIYDKIRVDGGQKKRITITGVDIQRSRCTSKSLREELEKTLGISLSEPEIEEGEIYATVSMSSRPAIEIDSYCATHSINEENGDTISAFVGEGDMEYMLICDGMGSGREAHLTSQMCASFLEKMLSATGSVKLCLSMLNNFIRAKNMECSSTVDLLEINPVTKEGRFIKSGASPSYVKRQSEVFKLQSKTAPIGIMRTLDAEELSFTLNKGDVCVMVSDGVVGSCPESKWLMQYLKDTPSSPDALAQSIIDEAKRRGGKKDDMSVVVAVIK